MLVPLSLHITVDGHLIRESFLWSLADSAMTAEEFAAGLARDMGLPAKVVAPVAASIEQQLQRYSLEDGLLVRRSTTEAEEDEGHSDVGDEDDEDEEDEAESVREAEAEMRRRRRQLQSSSGVEGEEWGPPPPPPHPQRRQAEALATVRLQVTQQGVTLRDQFQWDVLAGEGRASPEAFARGLCTDLGLPRQFEAAAAHAIREQVLAARGALLEERWEEEARGAGLRVGGDLSLWTPLVGPEGQMQEALKRRMSRYSLRGSSRGKEDAEVDSSFLSMPSLHPTAEVLPKRKGMGRIPTDAEIDDKIDKMTDGGRLGKIIWRQDHTTNRPRGPDGRFLSDHEIKVMMAKGALIVVPANGRKAPGME